ncbi:MAG TPA: 4-alpha-glucanotransferase [Rubrobacteraceae bacterium]|nr:4-alpha-glucanotransferase [Rubrobacteraceae bacterium]
MPARIFGVTGPSAEMKPPEQTRRSAGILLHPTSLPGPHGIGELGPEALRFVRFLKEAGQGIWQVLPLGPTEASPYSAYSAFAGNPLLISTDRLVEDGLLRPQAKKIAPGPVDYPAVTKAKERRLREAHGRWKPDKGFQRFREEHSGWLEDWALYAALKTKFGGTPWSSWPEEYAGREKTTMARAREELKAEISFHRFVQYLFFRDWDDIKGAANAAGIEVIGDVPIFVLHDSADVWANQHHFFLDERGEPTVVAGVPPDYFSEAGQLWGNPIYRWERMRENGYSWWIARLRMALTLCDVVRVDHFRGFQAYWEVPAGEETAANGRWVEGPGAELFTALRHALGELPLVAEDLGDITPEVVALREELALPGMKVLQFAFSDPGNQFLPHNHAGADWVVYTGTHDNNTTAGWWNSASLEERAFARHYLGKEYVGVWDFVRLAYSSVASRTVVPMQDVLGLGSDARMNTPGTVKGNWVWRMGGTELTHELAARLRRLAEIYGC